MLPLGIRPVTFVTVTVTGDCIHATPKVLMLIAMQFFFGGTINAFKSNILCLFVFS